MAFLNGGLIPGLHRPVLQQRLLHNKYAGPWMGPLLTESRMSAVLAKTFGPATLPSQAFLEDSYAALTFNGGHMIMHECALFPLPLSAISPLLCVHKNKVKDDRIIAYTGALRHLCIAVHAGAAYGLVRIFLCMQAHPVHDGEGAEQGSLGGRHPEL